jgi:hypothetical protein
VRTSSSLKGLMIAVINFMQAPLFSPFVRRAVVYAAQRAFFRGPRRARRWPPG